MLKFLRDIFERKSSDDAVWRALIDTGRVTASGVMVSPEKALQSPAINCAVRIKSEVVGMLPIHVYRRTRDGGKERQPDHPLARLLHGRSCPWVSSTQFVTQLERDSILHGRAYARATRVGGKVVELHRLDPNSVEVKTDDKTLEPSYVVTLASGGTRTLDWRDVLDVSANDLESPIKQCANSIGLLLTLEEHGSAFFRNGARPSGILTHPKTLGDAQITRLQAGMEEFRRGSGRYSTLVAEEGMTYSPVAFSSVDAQFAEMRAFQLSEVSRILAIPPVFLADYGRATFANITEAMQMFLTYNLMPRLKVWQGAIGRLMSADEQRSHFAEFLVDDLVKADIAARFEAYSKAIGTGVLSPNEVRSMENREPYEGGDEFRVPMNTEPPGQSDKPADKKRRPQ